MLLSLALNFTTFPFLILHFLMGGRLATAFTIPCQIRAYGNTVFGRNDDFENSQAIIRFETDSKLSNVA